MHIIQTLEAQARQTLAQKSCTFKFYLPKPENTATRDAACQAYIDQIQAIINVVKTMEKADLPAQIELAIFCAPSTLLSSLWGSSTPVPNKESDFVKHNNTTYWLTLELAIKLRELLQKLPLTAFRLHDAPQHVMNLLFPEGDENLYSTDPAAGETSASNFGVFFDGQPRLEILDFSRTQLPSWVLGEDRTSETYIYRPIGSRSYPMTIILDGTDAGNQLYVNKMIKYWISTGLSGTLSIRYLAVPDTIIARSKPLDLSVIEQACKDRPRTEPTLTVLYDGNKSAAPAPAARAEERQRLINDDESPADAAPRASFLSYFCCS
jgi:hypothetical protein